jgi:hypothetical protein
MRGSLAASILVAFALNVSCSDANQNTYAQAALATGILFGAVGIHRAITNDCWARCSPGYLCNHESGLCEPGECVPACEFGAHCARDVNGAYRCLRDSDPAVTAAAMPGITPATPPPAAPPPTPFVAPYAE